MQINGSAILERRLRSIKVSRREIKTKKKKQKTNIYLGKGPKTIIIIIVIIKEKDVLKEVKKFKMNQNGTKTFLTTYFLLRFLIFFASSSQFLSSSLIR